MALPAPFTASFFTKLPDEHWSQLLTATMQGSVKSRLPPGIDMNVNVLTSGYWPTYPHLEAKLPDELSRYQTVFKVPDLWQLGTASSAVAYWHGDMLQLMHPQ